MSSPPPPTVPASVPKADPELSESETDEEGEREEMKGITLSMIPPLRYLYKNKTLKQVAKEAQRFSHRADLLDRVSLLYVSLISWLGVMTDMDGRYVARAILPGCRWMQLSMLRIDHYWVSDEAVSQKRSGD